MRENRLTGLEASVYLTKHAKERIMERFRVKGTEQIGDILSQAVENGYLSGNGKDSLIEYGCLLIAGKMGGESRYIIETVYNLSRGISSALKARLKDAEPTPWKSAEVRMPDGEVAQE